jgi:predicted dehydrogenase
VGLRAGIAGYGLAGSAFHAPLIEATDGLEVAAVMTRSPERAAKAQAAHPDVRVVEDVDPLLDGIDLLVVATANSAHVPIALAGIERGLPVVVDKPLAVTASDARGLVEAGGRLTVFQNRRWDGDLLTVKRLIAEDSLGPITRFESRFERFRPEVADTWREHAGPAEGGGLLLDLGSHLVDQAVHLFGPPVSVYAEIDTRRPAAQVEDDVFVALEHAGGERSHLWMSAIAPLHGPRFRVSGLEAGFACDGLDPQEEQLREGVRPGDPGWGESEGLERGRYEDFYAGVRAWVENGAPPPVDPADAVRVLEVLEWARASVAA